jgi:hypothetical protein
MAVKTEIQTRAILLFWNDDNLPNIWCDVGVFDCAIVGYVGLEQ